MLEVRETNLDAQLFFRGWVRATGVLRSFLKTRQKTHSHAVPPECREADASDLPHRDGPADSSLAFFVPFELFEPRKKIAELVARTQRNCFRPNGSR